MRDANPDSVKVGERLGNWAAQGLLIIAISMILSGCATYREGALPGTSGQPEIGGGRVVVERGAEARVTLTSGAIWFGRVVAVSDSVLVLGVPTETGAQEQTIGLAKIASIAIRCRSYAVPMFGIGIVVGVVAYLEWVTDEWTDPWVIE